MEFVAKFNIDLTFKDAAKLAAFAEAFGKLYGDFFSDVGAPTNPTPRQTQAASLPVAPQPVPPAPPSEPVFFEAPKYQESVGTTTAPNPQVAIDTAPDAVEAPVAAVTTEAVATEPAKPKRHRATKAEMEARRAAQAQPDLPKPHGGSNTGTTAPVGDLPPLPTGERIEVPAGEVTEEQMLAAYAETLMLTNVEPDVLQLFSSLGISRCRDAKGKPELYKPVLEGLVRILRAHGK